MKPLEIFLAILLSIGAVQGLVYGSILLKKSKVNTAANRFLAAILLFFSYRLIVELLKLFGLGGYDIWYHLFVEFNWIYGALIYFFVKAYVTPKFKLRLRRDWIHFLPVIIEFAWSNYIKSQNFFWDGTRDSLSWLGYWGYVVWMHYPTMFVICGLLIIFYSYKAQKLLVSNETNTYLLLDKTGWIKRVLLVLRIYSTLLILIVFIDLLFFDYAFDRFYDYPLFIGMALVTYWLGIEGFQKRNIEVIKEKLILSDKDKDLLQKISEDLKHLMNEKKLFKDPDLSLLSLSKELGVKSYQTTRCLNLIFEKKFNDYINGLRIEELKTLLQDPKNQKFTLLSLAFEVGFNSKASFNRAVKKLTGKPPSHLKSII
ncbi:MAG: AraC family transcriptional regulator [Flavobacteriaceae bacterium]